MQGPEPVFPATMPPTHLSGVLGAVPHCSQLAVFATPEALGRAGTPALQRAAACGMPWSDMGLAWERRGGARCGQDGVAASTGRLWFLPTPGRTAQMKGLGQPLDDSLGDLKIPLQWHHETSSPDTPRGYRVLNCV